MQICTVTHFMEWLLPLLMLLGWTAARREMIVTSQSQVEDGGNFTVICYYQEVDLDSEVFSPAVLILARQTKGSSTFSQIARHSQGDSHHSIESQTIPAGRDWVIRPCNGTHWSLSPTDLCLELTVWDAICSDEGRYKCTGFYSNHTMSLEITQITTLQSSNCSASSSDEITVTHNDNSATIYHAGNHDHKDDELRGFKIGMIIAGFVIAVLIVAVLALLYQVKRIKNSSNKLRTQSLPPPSPVPPFLGIESPSNNDSYTISGDYNEVRFTQPRLSVDDTQNGDNRRSYDNFASTSQS